MPRYDYECPDHGIFEKWASVDNRHWVWCDCGRWATKKVSVRQSFSFADLMEYEDHCAFSPIEKDYKGERPLNKVRTRHHIKEGLDRLKEKYPWTEPTLEYGKL